MPIFRELTQIYTFVDLKFEWETENAFIGLYIIGENRIFNL